MFSMISGWIPANANISERRSVSFSLILAISITSAIAADDPASDCLEGLECTPSVQDICDSCSAASAVEDSYWWEDLLETTVRKPLAGVNAGLEPTGFKLSGYLLQGVNVTTGDPPNPPSGFGNLPAAGLIYRSDDFMLNRLWMSLNRTPKPADGCWDWGGNVSVMYGTDYFSLQSRGLETHDDLSNKWNSESGHGPTGNLMGLALPQLYGSVASKDVSIKAGHFYHPLGFESFTDLGNKLAYSSTYSGSFNQFRFVTGMQADWKADKALRVYGGFHRGFRNWEDNNDNLNGYLGFRWQVDAKTSVTYTGDVGAEDDAGDNDQYIQSIVMDHKLTKKLTLIFRSDYGHIENAGLNRESAEFYSFVGYLLYELTEKLTVGGRYELYDDIAGGQVRPRAGFPGRAPGIYHEYAVGGVYKWTPELWLRAGFRWDTFVPHGTVPAGPFDAGRKRDQGMMFGAMMLHF